ncbi:MAG: Fic family protein [Chloroflexi bacterium]|nr:Fic family protein [Chloroflexota bacterium]
MRFRDSPSGQVVRVGSGDAAYFAFVPAALPPDLEYGRDLFRLQSDADRALGELAGLGRTLRNPHLLLSPFMRKEAVLSSRIEGTQTGLAELYAFEAGHTPPRDRADPAASDAREVLNYVRALEYGLERLKTFPLSLRFLREVHERLMAGVRGDRATPGQFRTTQNWIGPPGCTLKEASFVPPPVPEMTEALDALEEYLHRDDGNPPLVRLALIHYQIEAIHPFLDGNGRIGRLLISLLLVAWDLLPVPLLYLSAFFERHRDDYGDLLYAVSERGAWTDWVSFFLRGVATQARDAVDRARRLQDLLREWREELGKRRAGGSAIRLMESLFEAPLLSVPDAQRTLGLSYPAAQTNVQRLVDAGILRPVGDATYGRRFVADGVLRAIGDVGGETVN